MLIYQYNMLSPGCFPTIWTITAPAVYVRRCLWHDNFKICLIILWKHLTKQAAMGFSNGSATVRLGPDHSFGFYAFYYVLYV